ncbi:acetyl-CoA synthetase-like protein [Artomyces pyxidatus]|uniref:Acetyl-CoA synthetase-like protein n=1 Tax=Artomyces pyxidatus TaxID=48021 RepID=A0ACB8T5Q8_9AGAM|nr:acetyl-CoA synthetase-like protein [Artomyces pyxidatus]
MSTHRSIPLPENVDYKKQSEQVPGTKRPGQTAHYRNAIFGFHDLNTPGSLTTLTEIFETGLGLSRDLSLLGHRPLVSANPVKYADHYVWQTWAEVDVRRHNLGSAIHALFQDGTLGGGDLPTVGIWSQNRPGAYLLMHVRAVSQWQIVEWALNAYAKVGVSLYDTLGRDSVGKTPIINHAHITVVFATANHIADLVKLSPRIPHLKLIVSMDEIDPEVKKVLSTWAETLGVGIREMCELEAFGEAHPLDPIPAKSDQVASICYTSGTTNMPKGAILTHGLLAAATQSNLYGYAIPPDVRGVLLSYLPLAHIYERINGLCVIAMGGCIGFFTGDPLRLLEDAQILRPNFFPSVPRVLNRIYQAAMVAGSAPGLKGAIFRRALEAKLHRLRTTGENTHALWDRLVFRKIQALLGGNIKLLTSGSAPISAEVVDFLKIAFSCDVLEGTLVLTPISRRYGMTENGAVATRCMPGDSTSGGTVGPPQPVVEIKLVDVPTMHYTSEDKPFPRGELCCRGASCFVSYYKDEKNTKETVDDEGWLHTGDVAEVDAYGRFRIIDRVKNIMKLSQGEYVALEKIENTYSTNPLIGQIFVYGDSLQSYLVAVIVPDPIQFAALASRVVGRPVSPEDAESLRTLARDRDVVQALLAELTKEGEKSLKGFELVKRIHVSLDPFNVEDNTLTPTLKIRRKDAYNKYKAELDALYALGEPSAASLRASKL